ncbi:MAG: hypothetical protein ABIW85_05775 [Variovorax sp.]
MPDHHRRAALSRPDASNPGDTSQDALLETWLVELLIHYRVNILEFDTKAAQIWGMLHVPHPEHRIPSTNDRRHLARQRSDPGDPSHQGF